MDKRIKSLDSLRGIAALMVALFHYTYGFNHQLDNTIFRYGYLGVFLFFMISGFVIFMSLNKISKIKQFLVARFFRLYPAYWGSIILILVLLGISYLSIISPLKDLGNDFDFIRILGNMTMFQHWFNVNHISGVYWTLTVELCFYILMILLYLFKQVSKVELWGVAFIILMILNRFLLQNSLNLILPLITFGHLFFSGIIFYKIKDNGVNIRNILLLILCLITQFLIWSFVESLVVCIFSGIFWIICTKSQDIILSPVLSFLGQISYSFYLIHEVLGLFIFRILEFYGVDNILIKISLSLLISVALAYFMFLRIEKRFVLFSKKLMLS